MSFQQELVDRIRLLDGARSELELRMISHIKFNQTVIGALGHEYTALVIRAGLDTLLTHSTRRYYT